MNTQDDEFIDEHDQDSVRIDNRAKTRVRSSMRNQKAKIGRVINQKLQKRKKRYHHIAPPNHDSDHDNFSDEDLEIANREMPKNSYKKVLKNTKDIGKRSIKYISGTNGRQENYEKELQDPLGKQTSKELAHDKKDEEEGHLVSDSLDHRRHNFIGFVIIVLLFIFFSIILTSISSNTTQNLSEDMFVETPPSNLEDLCDISNISTDAGHKQCETACTGARCCLLAGEKSCFLQNEDLCGLYWPCGTLYTQVDGDTDGDTEDIGDSNNENPDDVYVPSPPNDLDDICSDASLSTESGYIACESACHSGKCCFDEYTQDESSGIESCKESHMKQCLSYQPCTLLKEFENKHGSKIDIVNRKCAKSNIAKGGNEKNDCESICQSRSCCFFAPSNLNCRAENKDWCDEYQSCENLITSKKFEPGPENVKKETCSNLKNLSAEDMDGCLALCTKAKCCFFDDMSCHLSSIDCKDFAYCESVLDASNFLSKQETKSNEFGQPMQYSESSPADLACSEIVTDHGRDTCIFVCKDSKCCFDDSENGCQNNKSCKHFKACDKVLSYLK